MKWTLIKALIILAFVLSCPSAMAEVVVESDGDIVVDDIGKVIYEDTEVNIDLVNNLDQDVEVDIDSGDVDLSPTDFTVDSDNTRKLTYDFGSSVDDNVYFDITWGNTTRSVTQDVSVTYYEGRLEVDRLLSYSLNEKGYTKDNVYVENDGNTQMDIKVDYDYDYIIFITPDEFTLDEDEEVSLIYSVYGREGNTTVEFDVSYGGRDVTVKQSVNITTNPSQDQRDYRQKLEDYKSKANMVDNVMLNGSVKLNLADKWVVDESSPITVKLDGDPTTAFVNVLCGGDSDGLLVTGTETYEPNTAGECTFQVANYNGDVKKEGTVTVEKKNYSLSISNKEINEDFEVTVPQKGNVKVKCVDGPAEGDTVYDKKDYRHEISVGQGGKYRIVYDSQKYHGTDTFTVKGKVNLAVYANGEQIRPPGPLPIGGDLVVQAKTSGGKGIDGEVTAMMPAEAMGYSSDYAQQYQMWQSMMVATGAIDSDKVGMAPPGMMSQQISMQGGKAYLPIESSADKMVTLQFTGNEYVEGSTVSYKISSPLFTPMNIAIIGMVAAFAFLGLSIAYKYDKIPSGVKEKLSGIRSRFGGGSGTFDLE